MSVAAGTASSNFLKICKKLKFDKLMLFLPEYFFARIPLAWFSQLEELSVWSQERKWCKKVIIGIISVLP
jgi:hypothetical protein